MNLLVAILGPTASGKSDFAVSLAEKINGEIVSLDSISVYQGFDIGASKPSVEQRKSVAHHLVDILSPEDGFSAFHFVEQADLAIESIFQKGKTPLIVGGTYFYLKALQHGMAPNPLLDETDIEQIEKEFEEEDGLALNKMHRELSEKDPASAQAIHPNDKYRLVRAMAILRSTGQPPSEFRNPVPKSHLLNRRWMKYAFFPDRTLLHNQIETRVHKMLEQGLVNETKRLLEKYPRSRALQSVGYKETVQFIKHEITEKQLRSEITHHTRQLAKRQMTWLRSDAEVKFISKDDLDRVLLEFENLKWVLTSDS